MNFRTFGCMLLACVVGGPLIVCADEQHEPTVDFRTWTTRDGQQLDGKFLSRVDNAVRIESREGEEQTLDYQQLVEEDQRWIDQVVAQLQPPAEDRSRETVSSEPAARTWCDINGRTFRADLLTLDGSEVEFMLSDENRKLRMETLLLSRQDIDHILKQLNRSLPVDQGDQRFRVWSYQDANQNESRMIGLYVGLNQENLILNQPDGVRTIPIARLKPCELDYIVAIDNSTRGAIDPIRNSNDWDLLATQKKKDFSSGVPSLSPMWWFSLGLIFLLMLGLISVKYIYESQPEFDDDF